MARAQLAVSVRIEGVRETLRAFAGLPKEAAAELRDAYRAVGGL